jgi:hypothetical protein
MTCILSMTSGHIKANSDMLSGCISEHWRFMRTRFISVQIFGRVGDFHRRDYRTAWKRICLIRHELDRRSCRLSKDGLCQDNRRQMLDLSLFE